MVLQRLHKGLCRVNTRIANQIDYRTVWYGTEVRYRSVPVQYRTAKRMVESKGNDEFFSPGDLTSKYLSFHFHNENMLPYLLIIIFYRGGGSDKYDVVATANVDI